MLEAPHGDAEVIPAVAGALIEHDLHCLTARRRELPDDGLGTIGMVSDGQFVRLVRVPVRDEQDDISWLSSMMMPRKPILGATLRRDSK